MWAGGPWRWLAHASLVGWILSERWRIHFDFINKNRGRPMENSPFYEENSPFWGENYRTHFQTKPSKSLIMRWTIGASIPKLLIWFKPGAPTLKGLNTNMTEIGALWSKSWAMSRCPKICGPKNPLVSKKNDQLVAVRCSQNSKHQNHSAFVYNPKIWRMTLLECSCR